MSVLFDEELSDLGGLIEASAIPKDLPTWIGQFIYLSSLDLSHSFTSKFDAGDDDHIKLLYDRTRCELVNSLNFNAYAFKSGGHYLIGITVGAILGLWAAFSTLLSHPSALPEIGNVSLEREKYTELPLGFPTVTSMSLADGAQLERIFRAYAPEDPVRWHYAGFLEKCALDFLIRHELGHIIYGHVDYLENIGVRPLLPELPAPAGMPFSSDELQALEFQADTFASRCYASLLGDPKPWKVISFMLKRAPALAELMRGKLFALGVLFCLFSQRDAQGIVLPDEEIIRKLWSKEEHATLFDKRTHPRTTVRLDSCILCMREMVRNEQSGEVNDAFERVSKSTMEEVCQLWSRFNLPGASVRTEDQTATEICDLTLLLLQHDIVARKANSLSPIPWLRNRSDHE